MEYCINIKHKDVQDLSKQMNLPASIVAAKIAVWQEKNNEFDRFPTKEELEEPIDELNNTHIKEGVQELFESNPELANQIYEALGFKSTIQQTDIENKSKRKIDLSKPIVLLKGILIDGNNRLREANKTNKAISKIEINNWEDVEEHLNYLSTLDVGTVKTLIDYYNKYDKESYENVIDKYVYKSSDGKKTSDIWSTKTPVMSPVTRKRTKEEQIKFGIDSFQKAANSITSSAQKDLEKLEVISVTPQQKQQAQQLYSQYLDTIFPDSKVKDIVYHGTDKEFDKFDKNLSGSKTGWAKDLQGIYFFYNKSATEGYTGGNNAAKRDLWEHMWSGMPEEMIEPQFPEVFNAYKNRKDKNEYDSIYEWGLDYLAKNVEKGRVLSVITNVKNPLEYEARYKRLINEHKKIKEKLTSKNDGIIIEGVLDRLNDDIGFEENVLVVFEPEQIHLLGSKHDIEGFKNWVDSRNSQTNNNSLFGLNTQNQEQLEFHINTLNVVSQFLEKVGIEQRLVPEFLSQDGNVVKGALAAANFLQGTVDIIDDVNKRPQAWNKLPEEAAHWWYRLLNANSPLKKALFESHQVALKNDELYKSNYGKLVSKPEDLTEESIGQLIAEAIKRIETKNGSKEDYSFLKKFIEWINSILDKFRSIKQDPFEVAAMKILSHDVSDLLSWEEYKQINNIVNFADELSAQSVEAIDYSLISDIIEADDMGSIRLKNEDVKDKPFHLPIVTDLTKTTISFPTFEERDIWVFKNYGNIISQRQKAKIQEVKDNEKFFTRLLNKTYRKRTKFLPKTLRKYYSIIDANNLNNFQEWNIGNELQQITKKLSDSEKKNIIETNGYTNIAPTLKVLPDLLKKYGRKTTPEIIKQEIEITNKLVKKEITKEQATELRQKLENKKKGNPIVLSEPVKIDGAKKQELNILNNIREMIKIENPSLRTITAEEFVNEVHNWLETNYLLGFANEKSYLSYRTDQTFSYLSDRQSNEDVDITNMTEEELQRLPLAERQRIANIVGLTKQNPDVYHNKVSLRFNDMYHLKSGHFDKSPSAWGNLTYFYTGKNKWKDAVLLHEIQNDNIEFLREFKADKVDLEESLGRYLQNLNNQLLENIQQIESGGKKINRQSLDIASAEIERGSSTLHILLHQIYDLPITQGLQQLKERLNELIQLHNGLGDQVNLEKQQKKVETAYSLRRKLQDFIKRGGLKSVLSTPELEEIKKLVLFANGNVDENGNRILGRIGDFLPEDTRGQLKAKKQKFIDEVKLKGIHRKINDELIKIYGQDAPQFTLEAPAKPLPKSQRNTRIVNQGTPRQRTIGNTSQELNDNVNFLIAFNEKKLLTQLNKNIEEAKKQWVFARNRNVANEFNKKLVKITEEQYRTLIENYNYNRQLLNQLIDEQSKKDLMSKSSEEEIQPLISSEFYETIDKLPNDAKRVIYQDSSSSSFFGTWEFGYGHIYTSKEFPNKWFFEVDNNKFGVINKSDLQQAIKNSNKKENKVINQNNRFEKLKQKALDKKAELEKNYGRLEEEARRTLDIEMNYFTPLVHHLIQKHINQYGKDFPMYFSGYNITKLTQGNDRTALIYAGKEEVNIVDKGDFKIGDKRYIIESKINSNVGGNVFKPQLTYKIFENSKYTDITKQEYEKAYQQATERRAKEIKYQAAQQIGLLANDFETKEQIIKLSDKELEEGIKRLNNYKKQSKQNLDRVVNTIMNISNNKPIETGAIFNAMSQIHGIKLVWENSIPGLKGSPVNESNSIQPYRYIVKRGGFQQTGSYSTIEEAQKFIDEHSKNFKHPVSEYEIVDIKEEIPGGTGGYRVDLSEYPYEQYQSPILYGLDNKLTQNQQNFNTLIEQKLLDSGFFKRYRDEIFIKSNFQSQAENLIGSINKEYPGTIKMIRANVFGEGGRSIYYVRLDNQTSIFPNIGLEGIGNETNLQYQFKGVINILTNLDKVKQWEKQVQNPPVFWEKLQKDLQIPKEQISLLRESEGKDIEEKLTNFLASMSYTVEINTAKTKGKPYLHYETGEIINREDEQYVRQQIFDELRREGIKKGTKEYDREFQIRLDRVKNGLEPTQYYSNLTAPGGINYTENEIAIPQITPSIKGHAQFSTDNGIGWFRSDDKTELKNPYIRTYWNPDTEQEESFEDAEPFPTKTRRILEVQSDLFQKGRGIKILIDKRVDTTDFTDFKIGNVSYTKNNFDGEWSWAKKENDIWIDIEHEEFEKAEIEYFKKNPVKLTSKENTSNQFLQLLNKDNNWVTFFVKSIIQDSAKKGYEKVLFPTGNTASKVEEHQSLEEFKKQKEDRIKHLERRKKEYGIKKEYVVYETVSGKEVERLQTNNLEEAKRKREEIESDEFTRANIENSIALISGINNEIETLKQELERVEKEGFGALRPIYKFYEETVGNILKKQGYNPIVITDEYGNQWYEIKVEEKDKEIIALKNTEELNEEPEFKDEIPESVINFISDKSGNIDLDRVYDLARDAKLKSYTTLTSFKKFLQFFNIMQEAVPNRLLNIVLKDSVKVKEKEVAGVYHSKNHTIEINKSSLNKIYLFLKSSGKQEYFPFYLASLLTHEMVHAFTPLEAIQMTDGNLRHSDDLKDTFGISDEDAEFADSIHKMWSIAKDHYEKNKEKYSTWKHITYGLTSPEEFIAEALSNNVFQRFLSEIKHDGKKSLWENIMDALSKMLQKFGLNVDGTLLEAVFGEASSYLEKTIGILPGVKLDFSESDNNEYIFASPGMPLPDEEDLENSSNLDDLEDYQQEKVMVLIDNMYKESEQSDEVRNATSKEVDLVNNFIERLRNTVKELQDSKNAPYEKRLELEKRKGLFINNIERLQANLGYTALIESLKLNIKKGLEILDEDPDMQDYVFVDMLINDANNFLDIVNMERETLTEEQSGRYEEANRLLGYIKSKYMKNMPEAIKNELKKYGVNYDTSLKPTRDIKSSTLYTLSAAEARDNPELQAMSRLTEFRKNALKEIVYKLKERIKVLKLKFPDYVEKLKSFINDDGSFISSTSSEFYKEELKINEEFKNILIDNTKTAKEKALAFRDRVLWYKNNVEYYGYDGKNIDEEKVKSTAGWRIYEKLYNEQKKILTTDEGLDDAALQTWEKQNSPIEFLKYLNELEIDPTFYEPKITSRVGYRWLQSTAKEKWYNPKYDLVKDDELYKFIVQTIEQANSMIPHKLSFEVGGIDRILHKFIIDLGQAEPFSTQAFLKGIGDMVEDWVSVSSGSKSALTFAITDSEGNEKKFVKNPDLKKFLNSNSDDFLDNLVHFMEMAVSYDLDTRTLPTLNLLYSQVDKRQEIKTNKRGKVLYKPLRDQNGRIVKDENGNIKYASEPDTKKGMVKAKELALFTIESQIFGETRGEEETGKFTKVVDWFINYTRILGIGGKPFSGLNNYIVGKINNYFWAARKRDFDDKALKDSQVTIYSNIFRALKLNASLSEEGKKLAILVEKFGVMDEGLAKHEAGLSRSSSKVSDKLTELMYYLMTSGEYLIHTEGFLAKMLYTKMAKIGETQENATGNLWDYFQINENGEITYNHKDYGEHPEWESIMSGEEGEGIQKWLYQFNEYRKNTQGDYQNPLYINKFLFGRMAMIFRRWIPQMAYQRFGRESEDKTFKGRYLSIGEIFNHYTTIGKSKTVLPGLLRTISKIVGDAIILRNIGNKSFEQDYKNLGLSDIDVENMRVNIRELRLTMFIFATVLLFAGMGGDDGEENEDFIFLGNMANRVYNDLAFFYNPISAVNILRNPLPMLSTLSRAHDVWQNSWNYVFHNEKDEIQRGYYKGDSKLWRSLMLATPGLAAYPQTISVMTQTFGSDAYKYSK